MAARLDVLGLAENSWRLTPDRLLAHVTRNEPIIPGFGDTFNLSGPYQRPKHIRYLGSKIARKIAAGNGRLLISEPPQTGKSLLGSKATPLWVQYVTEGKARVLLASYEARFAASWGREVRDAIAKYGGDLALDLSSSSTATFEWQTSVGGGMQTAGVGGAFTGKPGDVIFIDDPLRNFKDAHSPTIRQDVWDWFQSVVMTRIQPGTTVIVTATRWHEEDLIGRLQVEPGHERWESIRLPALADEANDPLGRQLGESIWPERFDEEFYEQVKLERGPYVFAGMYQQLPAPLEGEIFKRGNWQIVDVAPAEMLMVRRWDLAGTLDGGDYTVGVLMGVTPDRKVFVPDVQRQRLSAFEVEQLVHNTAVMDHERYGGRVLIRIEQEPGSSGRAVGENFVKRVLQGFPAKALPSTGDKTLRALPYAAQQEAGNVHLVRSQGGLTPLWLPEYIEEHSVFPAGGHDDQVDASSAAFSDLMDLLGQRSKAKVARPPSAPLRPAGPGGRR